MLNETLLSKKSCRKTIEESEGEDQKDALDIMENIKDQVDLLRGEVSELTQQLQNLQNGNDDMSGITYMGNE